MSVLLQHFFNPRSVPAPIYSNSLFFSRFDLYGKKLTYSHAEPQKPGAPLPLLEFMHGCEYHAYDNLPKFVQTGVVFDRIVLSSVHDCPDELADHAYSAFSQNHSEYDGELFISSRIPFSEVINHILDTDPRLKGFTSFTEWFLAHGHPPYNKQGIPIALICSKNNDGLLFDPIQLYNFARYVSEVFERQPHKKYKGVKPEDYTLQVFCSPNDHPEIMEIL